MRNRVIVALMLVLFAACSRATTNEEGAAPAGDVVVQVRNDAFWDARVYLVRASSERVRIGIANSYSTTNLKVSRALIGALDQVSFQITWIGRSGRDLSDSILAQPGDTIELLIRE